MIASIEQLLADIRGCTLCAAHLPLGPRPIVQAEPGARILIIGQAPGSRVHETGIPWADQSGDRLRAWTGIDDATFYDPARIALMPIGFCYPGAADGADLPPRPECAPTWHAPLLAMLPAIRLTLLIGIHAQARYLPEAKKLGMTEAVRGFARFGDERMPLPHPSWRSTGWMRRNPWYEADVLPVLRDRINKALLP